MPASPRPQSEPQRKLTKAARDGDLEELSKLVEGGCDIDALMPRALETSEKSIAATALLAAVVYSQEAAVRFLLDRGADPNVATKTGVRPIHKACIYGQFQIVKKLVECGADVDVQDNEGNTALHYAARMGFIECVKALVANNANKRQQNTLKQVPADLALTPEIEELL